MAKLATFTDFDLVKSGAFPPKRVLSIKDLTAGGSSVVIGRLDNSRPEVIHASESVATLATRMNAANTTDVHKLNIPVVTNETTGKVETQNVMIDELFLVKEDPKHSALSHLWIENATKTGFNVVHASRSVAQIVTAANA